MTRCRFVKNTASDQTGAYGAQSYTDTEMHDCIFDRNTALRNVGTALIHGHCSLFMNNCTIMNSQSTQCTIALGQNVNGEVINGGFINNTSTMKCKCEFKYTNPANPDRNFCKQKLRPLPVLFCTTEALYLASLLAVDLISHV